MRWWFCGLGALMMVSCGGPAEVLDVKQFHLRNTDVASSEDEVVRGEKLKRLHGAVSAEQRRERMGEYFTVRWNGPVGRENDPVRVVFEYRQATTGHQILTMEREAPGTAHGKAEFHVTGQAYLTGGRVLAWRIRLYRGEELVETRRSYLWN